MAEKEEWSQEAILVARKIYRRNGSLQEAMNAVGTKLTKQSARKKFIRLGMRFSDMPSTYLGTSKMINSDQS